MLYKCKLSLFIVFMFDIYFISHPTSDTEPGYYEDGSFGVRVENCMLVVKAKTKVSTAFNFFFLSKHLLVLCNRFYV